MNKSYNFQMKVNGCTKTVPISVPYENGMVITSEFCPPQLLATGAGPLPWLQTSPIHGESEQEFINDCQMQIQTINEIEGQYGTIDSHQKALSSVVVAHIRRCGRLLFQDLLIYIDIYYHLLKAAGYSTTETKGNYALITKASVDSLAQYVKDSSTLCPIKESPVYGVISRLV